MGRRAAMLWISLAMGLSAWTPIQEKARPDFWKVIAAAVAKGERSADLTKVLEHLEGVPKNRDHVPHRLSRVNRGLAEPWTPPSLAADLKARLAAPLSKRTGSPFDGLLGDVALWLDVEDSTSPTDHADLRKLAKFWQEVQSPRTTGEDLLQALSAYVEEAHLQLEAAYEALTPENRSLIFEEYQDFFDLWQQQHDPDRELSEAQFRTLGAYATLFSELEADRAKILAVSESLLGLAHPTLMRSLAKRLAGVRQPAAQEKFGADILGVAGDTDWNRVVLMGPDSSRQTFTAALTIDLGGDDIYDQAAVADSEDMLVCIVLDLDGNDHYESSDPGPVFSAGGVALLVDRKGNDRYEAERLGQGASLMGFAALLDLEGDDTYDAEDFAQGHATCGVALLYDFAGDDTYSAHAFAQGAGIGNGLCALVDGAGNDSYLADLHWPDSYGDSGPNVFHGASQGYATGMRSNVAGGVAALIDLGDGQDRYQAGSFSQGGGYYFGFGLMFDGGGDDQAYGSRYAQGFGVHQAIGVKWDAGGDDLYKCRSVAHAGMAWDEGVGYLLDDAGDDVYAVGDLGCGGAAQTGLAVCIDAGGDDHYTTGKQSQGGTGSNEYHNKPSLGVLIDLGGGTDTYSEEGRADETLRATDGVQVFLDTAAKTMAKALGSKLLR